MGQVLHAEPHHHLVLFVEAHSFAAPAPVHRTGRRRPCSVGSGSRTFRDRIVRRVRASVLAVTVAAPSNTVMETCRTNCSMG